MDKYHVITSYKEEHDSEKLVEIIKQDDWVERDMIIVNCFPAYSSRLAQFVNHKLSYLNKNQLFEVMYLEIPYENTSQVWDTHKKEFENYEFYLRRWVAENVFSNKFLFILADTSHVKDFNKIKLNLRGIMDRELFRFASLYSRRGIIPPDYFVEEYDEDREILFQWENSNNPNY